MGHFELLTESDAARIHEASLSVMEKVGLDILDDSARQYLSRAGARVDGKRVYFSRQLVESEVAKAPEQFTLHARNPENNVVVGGESTLFLPANCPAFVMEAGKVRRYGTLADYENLIKLTASSKNLDMCSNILVEPSDVPPEKRNVQMLYATMRNTDKCFMGGALGRKGADETFAMTARMFGIEEERLPEKARVMSIPCSLTPLKYDDMMLQCLMAYAKAGQPVIVNSLAAGGATAPATLAGTLVVENAEILAGIVIAQLVREGTPIVYGGASSNADMRSGALCVGSPEMALNNALTAQMARFYKVPSRACGALTEAKAPGTQSSYESMMNLTTAVTAGLNIILHAAGSLDTINAVSYEKFMIDDELCGMAKRMKKGVIVSDETLGLDAIEQVGPGGHYLASPHTLKHFRTEFFVPELGDRNTYAAWEKSGEGGVVRRANEKWRRILSEYTPPELPGDVDRDLRRYMEAI